MTFAVSSLFVAKHSNSQELYLLYNSNTMTKPEMKPDPSLAEKKETAEKHVHFPESENKKSQVNPEKKKPYSRRFVIDGKNKGKANPVRDIGILLAVVVILLYLTRNFEMAGLPSDEDEEEIIIPEDPVANTLNKIANAFAKLAQSDVDSKSYRNEPCDLFLRLGSIPKTGYSLFAGKNYTQDEMIPIPGLEISRWFPVIADTGNSWNVAPHGFLLKHHPLQINVEGLLVTEADLTQSVSVRATRNIREGEELYVDFQQHPGKYLTKMFDSIPSKKDHEIATEIRRDVEFTGKRLVQGKRKKSIRINPAPMLSLMQRSMEKVRPQVAALLHHESIYEPLLMYHHKVGSVCPSDFVVVDSTSVRTRYAVTKGERLTVIPLHHFSTPNAQEGDTQFPDWALHCVSIDKGAQTDWYCPLTMSAQHLLKTSNDSSFNVEVKWTEYNELHARSDLYAWDLVAVEDLAAGSEVSCRLSRFLGSPY